MRVLPLTTAGAVAVRSPPRWAECTFSAAAEPAVRAWSKVTCTGLVRATARALAGGDTAVMAGACARAAQGSSANSTSSTGGVKGVDADTFTRACCPAAM